MVVEDDPCGDAQPFVLATPGQRFDEVVKTGSHWMTVEGTK